MQGHGRTADINRDYSFPALASDVSELLKYLKIDSADILGYSLGGTVAFQMAISYPQKVKNLVVISSVFKSDGWIKPAREIFTAMDADFFEKTPIKTEYDRLAPDRSHWKTFVDKMIFFDKQSYDLGADNIRSLRSPLLLIGGDNDGVDLNHVSEIYKLRGGGVFGDMAGLPKSQLAIIPGSTHVSLMMQTEKLIDIIDPFLKGNQHQKTQH